MDIMDSVREKLVAMKYPHASVPPENMLYNGEERYELLEWLFRKLLGPKSPYKIPSNACEEDDLTRVARLAGAAHYLYLTEEESAECIRGVGPYEERALFLQEVVNLAEEAMGCEEEGGKQSHLDAEVARVCQLLDLTVENASHILSRDCDLFPAVESGELHKISLSTPVRQMPPPEELRLELRKRGEELHALRQLLGNEPITEPGSVESPEEVLESAEELKELLHDLTLASEEFIKIYRKEIQPLEDIAERPKLVGVGPASTRLMKSYSALSELLLRLKSIHANMVKCLSPERFQSLRTSNNVKSAKEIPGQEVARLKLVGLEESIAIVEAAMRAFSASSNKD